MCPLQQLAKAYLKVFIGLRETRFGWLLIVKNVIGGWQCMGPDHWTHGGTGQFFFCVAICSTFSANNRATRSLHPNKNVFSSYLNCLKLMPTCLR